MHKLLFNTLKIRLLQIIKRCLQKLATAVQPMISFKLALFPIRSYKLNSGVLPVGLWAFLRYFKGVIFMFFLKFVEK